MYYYGLQANLQDLVNQRYLLPQDAVRTFQQTLQDILVQGLMPLKGTLMLPNGQIVSDEQ